MSGVMSDAAIYAICRELEGVCAELSVSVRLRTILDHTAPRCSTVLANGAHEITLNLAKIPVADFRSYAGCHVRSVLLPRMRVQTQRLVLRRYCPEDAEQCFGFLSDEQDAYMDCCKAFADMDEEFSQRVALFGQRETQYMVALKETGDVIGTVNLFSDESRAVDAMEIGYSIAKKHQRKGYGFEALSAVLDLLQKQLGLEMVTAGILPENSASEQLLTKLGFQREGLRHKAVWHEGLDRPVDLIYFYRDR